MCIRDSLAAKRPVIVSHSGYRDEHASSPVSYTHLTLPTN
ncbi:hypothetical protein JMUB7556_28350 [Staphylococcus aureus]